VAQTTDFGVGFDAKRGEGSFASDRDRRKLMAKRDRVGEFAVGDLVEYGGVQAVIAKFASRRMVILKNTSLLVGNGTKQGWEEANVSIREISKLNDEAACASVGACNLALEYTDRFSGAENCVIYPSGVTWAEITDEQYTGSDEG